MKKKLFLGLLPTLLISLVACNNDDMTKERVLEKVIYGPDENLKLAQAGSVNLLFKANSDVPYISLTEGTRFLSLLRQERLGGGANSNKYYYQSSIDNDVFTIKNEFDATCKFDAKAQTITYEDYDLFATIVSNKERALSMFEVNPKATAIQFIDSKYNKGEKVTVDLKPYSELDIYKARNDFYVPLSVYNSFLLDTHNLINMVYNFEAVFLIPQQTLTKVEGDKEVLTELGQKFYSGPKKKTLSDTYTKYYYQALSIDFDYNYGLKQDKNFTSFDKFVSEKGFKEDLLSGDVIKMDNATAYALTYFDDHHTAMSRLSAFYNKDESTLDTAKFNPKFQDFSVKDEQLKEASEAAGITNGYQIVDDTIFIKFAMFTEMKEQLLYKDKWESEDLNNTAVLFASAYQGITDEENRNKIKNVVVDLTVNDGGASDGLTYALATLIGNVTYDISNPISKGFNHHTYKADINCDRVIDEKDKSLLELGYNIVFLNSEFSFSSANALPVLAKALKPEVMTIGEKTAGGPCVAREVITPLCNVHSISGLNCINKNVNGQLVNIDGGVEADHPIKKDKMFDRNYIVSQLKTWIN